MVLRITFFLLISALALAQEPYPEDYFRSPLDLPVHPSGTFGEIRRNHFHAGLDYRTQQKTGIPVLAAGDGFVSRIKVSTYGYGTCLYIDHPNGYTTVYGHLSSYADKIDAVVRAKQYEKQTFDIEMMFEPGELPVQQGEVVALSGNTGGSGGPHLHFEYRDTKTEKIINPLHFGLKKLMKDTKAPTILGLMVYPLGESSVADGSEKPFLVNLKPQKDGTYLADKITAKGKIGFSVSTSDKSTGSYGNNGIYKVQTFYNGSPGFNYTFDTFGFHESRYINNFIDYEHYYKTNQRFQKLFYQTAYPLSIVEHNTTDGQLDITPDAVQNYRIEVYDFHGNKTMINGSIDYSDAPAKVTVSKYITPYFVNAANDNSYTKDGVSVFIPANTFYENFYMNFNVKDSVLYLHKPEVPVHDYITISFDVSHLPKSALDKTFIEGVTGNRKSYHSSYIQDGMLTAKVKTLGNFKLDSDTTPPKIYSPSFTEGKWLSTQDSFSLKMSDDLSGIATYDAWINGKWALLHYDYKTRIIFHNFSDGIVSEGRNDLKVVVTDNVGNSTTFETHFFRK